MVGEARSGQEQTKGEIVMAATSSRQVSLRFMMRKIGMDLGFRRGGTVVPLGLALGGGFFRVC